MTVKELIEELQKFPGNLQVMTYDSNYSLDRPIDSVVLIEKYLNPSYVGDEVWGQERPVVFIEGYS